MWYNMNISILFGYYFLCFRSDMTHDMPKLQPPSSPVYLESSSHSSQHRNQWPVKFPINETMFKRSVWNKLNKKVPLN